MLKQREMTMNATNLKLCFIGFGEAAEAFWSGMDHGPVASVQSFDSLTEAPGTPAQLAMQKRCDALQVPVCANLATAVNDADVVISVVTADQAYAVAEAAAPLLTRGALFLDCNSCAPQTKQASARAIEAAGGRYVDVAVMAPVNPGKNRTPLLLSGSHTEQAKGVLDALAMNPTIEPGPVGTASSVKMVRSIMVKGMEALFAECVLAGRLAGVDTQVLASLEHSHPGFDWTKRAGYNLERMTQHGLRRASEMEEVCHFLNHLGIEEPLSASTVRWQNRLGYSGIVAEPANYAVTPDAMIKTFQLTPMKEVQR
jgi:3-hydroxyisobutyrate dehydrogenase-like beta-hydroxyacid dehydrogenase